MPEMIFQCAKVFFALLFWHSRLNPDCQPQKPNIFVEKLVKKNHNSTMGSE
jgi:hypothetical protein